MDSILIIYTGGTIGMVRDEETGVLKSFDFDSLMIEIPEIKKFKCSIESISFNEPIDSSNMQPKNWSTIAQIIYDNYNKHDGFVVLHGSDTMAYTASALSFMLENLSKPVILTGSQLPIGDVRTDAKENLLTAIEIASAKKDGKAAVPEVAIYFEYDLYRGNRSTKSHAEDFEAFSSPNYPVLAQAGVSLKFSPSVIYKANDKPLKLNPHFNNNIATLKLFPGISEQQIFSIINIPNLKAIVLETFGAGNASTQIWFIDLLIEAIKKRIIILNISQCEGGSVDQGKYETSSAFDKIGVVSGKDMTYETAVTKLMYLLGTELSNEEIKESLQQSLRGEVLE
ncbi:MAG: L-asparaginase 1 [Flavobacteriales bacterium]|nr:MAG: L-asparaginase 1 [Flavobacteriales bacterium]